MKKKILIGSIIAITIIVLSSFSSVVGKVSSDEEFVELDVEFSGLGKKHTVQLTRHEAEEVELLFDDIEQRLSEVESREEAEVIFKDAVVELDKYGLLGGISIKQTQKLICGVGNKPELLPDFKNFKPIPSYINLFCLIWGDVESLFLGTITLIGLLMSVLGATLLFDYNLIILGGFISMLGWAIEALSGVYSVLTPFPILQYGDIYSGKVTSIGLNGYQKVSRNAHGQIIGFTGLKFYYQPLRNKFFGFAPIASTG